VTPAQQLDSLARRDRLRTTRNWCFGVGLGACVGALLSLGAHVVMTSPSAWAPTGGPQFSAVAVITGAGWRPLAGPLLVCGVLLLVVASVLTIVLRMQR
jgi:hypothetical protein